jgi:hypothetical protein
MNDKRFESYEKAKQHFGIGIPEKFVEFLNRINILAEVNDFEFNDVAYELFELLRIEGHSARYQQTPPEFFPFGSNGSDGEHFGFIIHIEDQLEYPSGFLYPMDSEGVVFIGSNTFETFQTLLTSERDDLEKYQTIVQGLNLYAEHRKTRYENISERKRPIPARKDNWHWQETSDGVGVFAPQILFHNNHVRFDEATIWKVKNVVEYFSELAHESGKSGHYGSQLYYLKELFWQEWTQYDVAVQLLKSIRNVYESLNREHLFLVTDKIINDFETRYK